MHKHKQPMHHFPPELTGGRSYDELKSRFMSLLEGRKEVETKQYSTPEMLSQDRVTYIIPPITHSNRREQWKPRNVYVVRNGIVAIGRVFYTKTSGEYLIEELILKRGDIFGEFEVPLSILGESSSERVIFPPRFSMTYGAWASGPSLNWAMAYPRDITWDSVVRGSATVAVHPFYIKSKNIRPETNAEVSIVPVECFENIITTYPEAMTWVLMNVLRKTRLYFEPPSQGYARDPRDIISCLIIRLLTHRIRLGIVVTETSGKKMSCHTFIGPTEWVNHGLGEYRKDFKEIVQSLGGDSKKAHKLPLFSDDLADVINVTYHFPVKDLDNTILIAMGCIPDEDKRENRYGLLTGIKIDCTDLDFFINYLLAKGE